MKYLKAFSIVQIDQLCGFTDRTPLDRLDETNHERLTRLRVWCSIDLRRTDYNVYMHTPSNYACVMACYPKDAQTFNYKFYLN